MVSAITIEILPIGSVETAFTPIFGPDTLGASALDGLANATESIEMSYANPSGQTYATVEILLNPITPTGTPTIQIISGSSAYEMSISTTANIARRIKFVDIPATFLSSFTVKNNLGVALASIGNFVVVTPKY